MSIVTLSPTDKAGDQYSQDIKHICQFKSQYGCKLFGHVPCAQKLI
jgi:hypothetical protein